MTKFLYGVPVQWAYPFKVIKNNRNCKLCMMIITRCSKWSIKGLCYYLVLHSPATWQLYNHVVFLLESMVLNKGVIKLIEICHLNTIRIAHSREIYTYVVVRINYLIVQSKLGSTRICMGYQYILH